jgi:hypothetical protein
MIWPADNLAKLIFKQDGVPIPKHAAVSPKRLHVRVQITTLEVLEVSHVLDQKPGDAHVPGLVVFVEALEASSISERSRAISARPPVLITRRTRSYSACWIRHSTLSLRRRSRARRSQKPRKRSWLSRYAILPWAPDTSLSARRTAWQSIWLSRVPRRRERANHLRCTINTPCAT